MAHLFLKPASLECRARPAIVVECRSDLELHNLVRSSSHTGQLRS